MTPPIPDGEEPVNETTAEDEVDDGEIARLTLYDDASGGEVAVTVPAKPEDQLRKLTLIGLFGLVTLSLIMIFVGQIWHWLGEDFAKTLIQTIISPILGALTAIIGYLFAERKASR